MRSDGSSGTALSALKGLVYSWLQFFGSAAFFTKGFANLKETQ